jgi:hypothetical protein
MTPLSTSLVGGALGAGIGLLCGCPDRAFKYGIVGLLAGGLVGKLATKRETFAAGFQCPEGFDIVSSDHQIACAYRGQSACLAGTTDASGQFVCTSRDFDCPPGMFTRKGSPANWCFPA